MNATTTAPSAAHVNGTGPAPTTQPGGPHPHWTPKSWAELANRPPKEYLIDQVLARGEVGMIYAQPGHGKTFCAIDLTMCAIQGIPWVGTYKPTTGWDARFSIPDPLRVMYCTDEGLAGLAARFRAAVDEYNPPQSALDNLSWTDLMPLFAPQARGPRAWERFVEQWRYLVQDGRRAPDLIVLDTFANAAAGANENDNSEMHSVLTNLRAVARELDCAILLLHHTGKSGLDYRGASSVKGSIDFIAKVSQSGPSFILECERAKDAELWPSASFALTKTGDSCIVRWDDLTVQAGQSPKTPSVQQLVLAMLTKYPAQQFSAKELAAGIGRTETSVQNALGRLADDGRADQVPNPSGGRVKWMWQLSAAIRAANQVVSP